jgi:transposase
MVNCTNKQIRELKTAVRWKVPEAQRQRIQMVLLRESGMTQRSIAEAMGVSLSTVNRAHMAFDHGGIQALKPKPIGGRQRENMTLAEEKALLRRFAKAAGAGEMLNIHELKTAYQAAIGHATNNSTIYNLLARHGWRKLMPRPFHSKRDLAAQHAFKKRLSPRGPAGTARGCPAWPPVAGDVCRWSAFWPDEPAAAVLGRPAGHPAASGLPAHSRIHLFVRCGLSAGWKLRLFDYADLEHELLPKLPQCLVAKICQAGYPLVLDGAPNHRCDREKIFKNYAIKSIEAVYRKLEEAILYIERSASSTKTPEHWQIWKCVAEDEFSYLLQAGRQRRAAPFASKCQSMLCRNRRPRLKLHSACAH